MFFVKFNNQQVVESSIDLSGGAGGSVLGDRENMLSQDSTKKRKSLVMFVTMAVLVSIIILCVPLVFTHVKLVHQLVDTQESLKLLQLRGTTNVSVNLQSSRLYTFGGMDGNNKYLSSSSMFNRSTGRWMRTNPMPFAASYMCGAVAGDKIYFFGGVEGSYTYPTTTNRAVVYDSSANSYYNLLQPLPEKRESCGAAFLNGNVYVAGGSVYSYSSWKNSSSLIRYNTRSGKWSTLSPMSTPRRGMQLVELGGLLYAIGGKGVQTVEVYDPLADHWSFVASPGFELAWFGATVHDGKIYALDNGGFKVYSPEADDWKSLNMPNTNFIDPQNMVSMNGKLWIVGGFHKNGTTWIKHRGMFSYDISSGEWTKEKDLDVARGHNLAFVVNR